MTKTELTFDDICELVPRIRELWNELPARVVTGLHARQNFFQAWSQIKKEFMPLVGWDSTNELLCNNYCYDTVYQTLCVRFEDLWPSEEEERRLDEYLGEEDYRQ